MKRSARGVRVTVEYARNSKYTEVHMAKSLDGRTWKCRLNFCTITLNICTCTCTDIQVQCKYSFSNGCTFWKSASSFPWRRNDQYKCKFSWSKSPFMLPAWQGWLETMQIRRQVSKSATLIDKVQVRNSSSVLPAVHLESDMQVQTWQRKVQVPVFQCTKIWGLHLKVIFKFKTSAHLSLEQPYLMLCH